MADLIDRQELLKRLKTKWEDAVTAIKKSPTVDAVEVVRCEKCYWWHRHTQTNRDYGGCHRYASTMRFDDYCSRGRQVVFEDGEQEG